MDDLLRERMEQDAEEAFQLRFRISQGLNVPPKGKELVSKAVDGRVKWYAFGLSLAAALLEVFLSILKAILESSSLSMINSFHELFRPLRAYNYYRS
jgi:hypothetical protein